MKRMSAIFLVAFLACGSTPKSAKKAESLLSAGNYAGAGELASSELKRFPDDPTLWHVKIRANIALGDNRAAVDAYEQWVGRRGGAPDDAALRAMAIGTLWQGLKVPSPEVRVAAIQAVERLEIERLGRDVAELMASDDDPVAAAAGIAILRSHPQAPQVVANMLTSDNARARAIAITGLGRKMKQHARVDITRALGDPDAGVRRAAIGALVRIADDQDSPALMASAQNDRDGSVRARAMRALAKGKRRPVVDLAARMLDDDFLGARLAAIEYLELHGGDMGSGHLVKAAASQNPVEALRAIVALNQLGRGGDVALVERAVADKVWTVRASALNALARAVPRETALRLAKVALTDSRVEVRLTAARALVSMGAKETARPVLRKALYDPSGRARLDAAADLYRMGDRDVREVLSSMTTHRDPELRAAAIPLQRLLGHPSKGLTRALADDSARLRLLAAELVLELLDD